MNSDQAAGDSTDPTICNERSNKSEKINLASLTSSIMDKRTSIASMATPPVTSNTSFLKKFQTFALGEEKAVLTDAELRKYIFRQERSRHVVDALRVPTFTRQSFVHSFLVGLVVGCFVAVLLKVLVEVFENVIWRV